MKQFDDSIKPHYDEDEYSNKSVAQFIGLNKRMENDNQNDDSKHLVVRTTSRQNSQEQSGDKVINIYLI